MELAEYIKSLGVSYYKMINYGDYIVSYETLKNIKLKKNDIGNKIVIILNSNQNAPSNTSVGHWFLILINLKKKSLLMIDSLNYIVRQNSLISKSIKKFCLENNLQLVKWDLQTQQSHTNVCGFQVIFFLHYFKNNSIYNFKKLKQFLIRYKIHNRELYILKKIKNIL